MVSWREPVTLFLGGKKKNRRVSIHCLEENSEVNEKTLNENASEQKVKI